MSDPKDSSSHFLEAALFYARRGWPVFPLHNPGIDGACSCRSLNCTSKGKHPRTLNGLKSGTVDEKTIGEWWGMWPNANVGIGTGLASGLVVLDVDPRNGGDDSLTYLEKKYGKLPDTIIAQTGGGGTHYLFQHPGFPIKNKNSFIKGLDIKADGGYIVASPSIHASGKPYFWDAGFGPGEIGIVKMPSWLFSMISESPLSEATVHSDSNTVVEGSRNNHLARIAGKLRNRGLDQKVIFAALIEENKKCVPPLTETEVSRIALSISRYPVVNREYYRNIVEQPKPKPLAQVGYHGVAGELINLILPHTEAHPVAMLVQFLVAFGNIIGRKAHFPIEGIKHYLNFFSVLVGDTAKGRKGTSWGQIRVRLNEIDSAWVLARILSGLSSGEGLVFQVRDDIETEEYNKKTQKYETRIIPGVKDKRLLIVEPEFVNALNMGKRVGNTLSPIIRDAWDSGTLQFLTKNNQTRATGAHISIIGHITKNEILKALAETDTSNGFGNRFLWIFVERHQTLPEGGQFQNVDFTSVTAKIASAVRFSQEVSEMEFHPTGRALWHEVYGPLSEGKPGLLGALTARSEAITLRLACIFALLDETKAIEQIHLEAALAIWKYSEESCLYIFGGKLGDYTADEIIKALRVTSNGMTRTQIRDLFSRNKNEAEISRALGVLLSSDLVYFENETDGNGRPTETWFLSKRVTTKTTNGSSPSSFSAQPEVMSFMSSENGDLQ